MHDDLFLARLFWLVGGTLTLLGAVLWFTIPIRPMFPPYLVTALLSLGYGAWCRRQVDRAAERPKS